MSKPLVTPSRYIIRCYFSDGSESDLMIPKFPQSDRFPSRPPTLRSIRLYETGDSVSDGLTLWQAPRPR